MSTDRLAKTYNLSDHDNTRPTALLAARRSDQYNRDARAPPKLQKGEPLQDWDSANEEAEDDMEDPAWRLMQLRRCTNLWFGSYVIEGDSADITLAPGLAKMRRAMQILLDQRSERKHRLKTLAGALYNGDRSQRTHMQFVFPCREKRWSEMVAFSIFVYRPDMEEGEITLICTKASMEGLGVAEKLVQRSLQVANKAKLRKIYVQAGTAVVPLLEGTGKWLRAVREPTPGFKCGLDCHNGELYRQDLRTEEQPLRKRELKALTHGSDARH